MSDGPPRVVATTTTALADLVARAGLRVWTTGWAGHAVRVGLDGPVTADTAALADAVAAALGDLAVPVARVRSGDFLRARSLRREHGRHDPRSYSDQWFDLLALRREVLDPLGPGGRARWLPRLRDAATDRAFRDRLRPAEPGMVVVLDGSFLARPELAGGLDLLVHLQVSTAAVLRRSVAEPDGVPAQVVAAAWQGYLEACRPAQCADHVVRFDHPDRPALVLRGTGPT